jgi:hypothetical protein
MARIVQVMAISRGGVMAKKGKKVKDLDPKAKGKKVKGGSMNSSIEHVQTTDVPRVRRIVTDPAKKLSNEGLNFKP